MNKNMEEVLEELEALGLNTDQKYEVAMMLGDVFSDGEKQGIEKMANEMISKDKENDSITVSNCCGASIIENTDLCSDCKEHCSPEEIEDEVEYTREDEAYDRASSNAGELI